MRMLVILLAVALGLLRRDVAPPSTAVQSAVREEASKDPAAKSRQVHSSIRVNRTAKVIANHAGKMNKTFAGKMNKTFAGKMNKTFEESCKQACNACQAEHAMQCTATCYRGCSQKFYDCKEELDPVLGCDDEMWSAMPGSRPDASLESVRTYRICDWGYQEIGIMEGCRIY